MPVIKLGKETIRRVDAFTRAKIKQKQGQRDNGHERSFQSEYDNSYVGTLGEIAVYNHLKNIHCCSKPDLKVYPNWGDRNDLDCDAYGHLEIKTTKEQWVETHGYGWLLYSGYTDCDVVVLCAQMSPNIIEVIGSIEYELILPFDRDPINPNIKAKGKRAYYLDDFKHLVKRW